MILLHNHLRTAPDPLQDAVQIVRKLRFADVDDRHTFIIRPVSGRVPEGKP